MIFAGNIFLQWFGFVCRMNSLALTLSRRQLAKTDTNRWNLASLTTRNTFTPTRSLSENDLV